MRKHTNEQSVSGLIRQVLAGQAQGLRYIGYGRVSTTQQRRDGNSLDGQRGDIEEWADGLGLIQHAYIEESHSGWRGTRPCFQALIDGLEEYAAAGVQLLIVFEIDRLARNVQYALNVIPVLTAHRVAVVSIIGALDYTTADGWKSLVERLTGAEYHSRNLSQKMQATRRREATRLRRPVGSLTTGYQRTPGGGIVPDTRAAQQRHLFELFASDLYTLATAAAAMNAAGHRAWNERAGAEVPYTKWNVVEMLRNPIYLGKVRHHGQVYDGQHEPLIDAQTWQRVQDILERRGTRRPVTIVASGPFTGLLYCEDCGAAMWQHVRHRGLIYYECSGRHAEPRCPARSLTDRQLLPDVLCMLDGLRLSDAQKRRIVARMPRLTPTPEPPPPQSDELDRLIDLYTSGLITRAKFEEKKIALTMPTPIARPAPDVDMDQAFALLDNIADLVQQATAMEQRAILQSLFAAIWATKERGLIAVRPQPVYLDLVAAALNPRNVGLCSEPGGGRTISTVRRVPIVAVWSGFRQVYIGA